MNLKIDQNRYKVFLDESYKTESESGKSNELWRYYEIRGKYGHIYPYSDSKLGMFITSNIISNKIHEKEWKIIQNGQEERVYLLPNNDLDKASQYIKARKKRHLSPQQIEELKKRVAKFRFNTVNNAG